MYITQLRPLPHSAEARGAARIATHGARTYGLPSVALVRGRC